MASLRGASIAWSDLSCEQGCPLVVVVGVYLVDQHGSCSWVLPNMGVAHCYLGHTWSTQRALNTGHWTDFFRTPEFIYKHSVILALEISNVLFFALTIRCLVRHWRSTAQLLNTQTKMHFGIIFKLFLITGNTHKNQTQHENFTIRYPLDWSILQ